MSIKRKLRGIRDKLPAGYVLGRVSRGEGPVELIKVAGLSVPPGAGGNSNIVVGGGGGSGFLTDTLTDAHIFVGNASNIATDVPVSGDLTLINTGAFTIANDAVSNAKLANMAAWTLKARNNAASGDPQDATLADFTEEATPAAGMFLAGWLGTGELRKFDIGNIASVGSWVPTVDGSEPPVFITDGAGVLIFTFYMP
jgi:hypothetical protein